ncbi:MAG: serine hydrolase domain-containing protein [Bacteroidota bacterium]
MTVKYNFSTIVLSILIAFGFLACEKNEIVISDNYDCLFEAPLVNQNHPKSDSYQNILNENRKLAMVGAVLLVKDSHGIWTGASGFSDIASNVEMQSCNRFAIASISKAFTSAAIYRLMDKGILSIDDPINKWLDRSITDNIKNANEATISHLLAHTSGIADFYTTQFELDRLNKVKNDWTKEEVLEYTYGKAATNGVDETYSYSNTNFLLLAMISEAATGLDFETVYQREVFNPLNLSSAYYSENQIVPNDMVKGYADIYGNGQFVESRFAYADELGIGGDGGVIINAYDLAVFLERLVDGQFLSEESLSNMTNWFDMPEDYHWDTYGQFQNGFGIEKFDTQYGTAIGHTGGIDGFSTYGFYFPERDATYVLLINSVSEDAEEPSDNIFNAVLEVMFEH